VKKEALIGAAVVAAAGIAVGIAFAAGAVGGKGDSGGAGAKDPFARTGRPVLMPVSQSPLRVKGTGFKQGEHVRLTAASATKKVQANDQGSFVATVKGARACDAGTVVAKGDRGSRASFNFASLVCDARQ
jgi:hypothetical protein